MMHHPEEANLSDPARHYFVPSIPPGLADETICHYCRRPANEHRQRASSGGSTAPAGRELVVLDNGSMSWESVDTRSKPR